MAVPVKSSKMFGAGRAYFSNNITTPTPGVFDTPQDWEVTFKRDVKSIMGQSQFPDDVCAGASSITWKLSMGSISGRIIGDLVVGAGVSVSGYVVKVAPRERQVAATSSGGYGKISVRNHGTGIYLQDLGAVLVSTNMPLIRVPAKTDIHKVVHYYATADGQYFFHANLIGVAIDTSYRWTGVDTGLGANYSIPNLPQGKVGDFTAIFASEWAGEQNVMTLNSNLTDSFTLGTKQGDYGKPTISGQAGADAYGNVGNFSFAQQR